MSPAWRSPVHSVRVEKADGKTLDVGKDFAANLKLNGLFSDILPTKFKECSRP